VLVHEDVRREDGDQQGDQAPRGEPRSRTDEEQQAEGDLEAPLTRTSALRYARYGGMILMYASVATKWPMPPRTKRAAKRIIPAALKTRRAVIDPSRPIFAFAAARFVHDRDFELYWSDYPIPFNHRDARLEVVYIDKDYLRRCGGPPIATVPGGG
jgi:hypothetical protein